MNVKVWNAELPPYPREGLNPLEPSADCPVTMLLKQEAAKLARLHQLDAPETPAALRRFQRKLRAGIWSKLGTAYDPTVPLDVKEYGTLRREGFSVRKLTYQSRPGIHVTALLYVPEGEGPFPGVIHMHGHTPEGKLSERIQLTSLSLVKNGYVVLAVDAFGVYERAVQCHTAEYHGGFLGGALLNLGESLMGEQVVDNMRGVDLLASLPFVRKDRIGATGASGGGNQTMWLSALDERIAAAMPVVSVGSFESYVDGVNCVCELLPDGLTFTEETGVLALIAPRPLNIGNAFWDVNHTFSVSEMLKTYHQVEEVYWKLNVPGNIRFTVANRVHGMMDEQREAMLGWFALHLKGEGNGNPVREPVSVPEDIRKLSVFPDPSARPAEVRTTDVHCRIVGAELRKRMLETPRFDAAAKRRELARVLRLRPLPGGQRVIRYADRDGFRRLALEAGDHLIPIVMRPGTVGGKYTVLLHPDGKAALTDAAIAAAGADGATVVMFDPFGAGETARSNHLLGMYHQTFRQLLWIGRSLPGEWVFDILAVVRMLKRTFRADSVLVRAEQEAGMCALFAAALGRGDFAAEIVNAPASYLFRSDSIRSYARDTLYDRSVKGGLYTFMLPLPGFLRWGDISLAAALCPSGDVKFLSPRAYDGTPYTAAEEADFLAECAMLRRKLK
ncbi:MAG: acetylxylan esterase [Lentisphaeria bacterium]|nr:acetylxylan esterase [Lentisphaeria bacterium]